MIVKLICSFFLLFLVGETSIAAKERSLLLDEITVRPFEKGEIDEIYKLSQLLISQTEPGDVYLFIGDSPKWLAEAFKIMAPERKMYQISISGVPRNNDYYKVPKGKWNGFKKYLKSLKIPLGAKRYVVIDHMQFGYTMKFLNWNLFNYLGSHNIFTVSLTHPELLRYLKVGDENLNDDKWLNYRDINLIGRRDWVLHWANSEYERLVPRFPYVKWESGKVENLKISESLKLKLKKIQEEIRSRIQCSSELK
jgi:hypothetical protein